MKKTTNYEINLRTKAWGLTLSGNDLILTSIHNRFNQFEYGETLVIKDVESMEDSDVIEQIEDFLAKSKVRRGDAFLGIPFSEVHAFTVEFPREAEETLADTIEYQIEGLYPGDIQEIDVFHQIIGRDELLKVQIFCVPKTYIGKIFGLIRKWKLKLAGITMNHLAIFNAATRIYKNDIQERKVAILHFEPSRIEILGIRDGIFSGIYACPLDDPTSKEELGQAFEEGFSQIRLDPYEVDDFLFSGRMDDSLQESIQRLGVQSRFLKDTKDVDIPPEGLVGVGLAMTAIHERVPFKLNILPSKLQGRHHQLPVLVAILVIIGLLGWFATDQVKEFMGLKSELHHYQTRNKKLNDQLMELTQARNQYEERLEMVDNYKKYIYGENLMLKVITVLAQELPDHTFLTSFVIRDGVKLTMNIETEDFFEVRNKLDKLPYFTNVDTANAISQARSGNKRKTNIKMDIVLEAFHE